MRLDRIKAYLIDLVVILIIYIISTNVIPRSDLLKKYKSDERELHENYVEKKISMSDYTKQYEVLYYNISRESKVNDIVYVVSLLIYFVVVPFFLNGQTLGLFLNRLRIERFTIGKLHMWQLLVRNVVIVGLGYSIFRVSLVYFLDAKIYYKVLLGISAVQILLLLLSWIMVIRKKEKRGLHEILSNTEVVSLRKRPKKI
ncbi:MAG: RDD family protein [Bacilli bacterium]|nr:RDD family protein [Bacilli bacterium]